LLRLLGIVLNKLLLFGEDVSKDKYQWQTDKLQVGCKLQSYNDLIDACFHPNITAPYVGAFVRSICVHDFGTPTKVNSKQNLDVAQILKELKSYYSTTDILKKLFWHKIEDESIWKAVIDYMRRKDFSVKIDSICNTAIAMLATIPPLELKLKLEKMNTLELTTPPQEQTAMEVTTKQKEPSQSFSNDIHNNIISNLDSIEKIKDRRRIMVSLANTGLFENQMALNIASRLCRELKDTDDDGEKKQVLIGLKELKVVNGEVMQTVYKLLEDNDAQVKLEAGKTLTTLQALANH
jgi:hypothetical protein